eukprot:PRCOL_00004142-RA
MLRSPAQQGAAAGGAAAGGTPSAVGAGGTRAAAAAAGPALNLPLPQRATSSALALLFSEVVQRARDAAATGDELEARLADAGADVGTRAMELVAARQRPGRREIRLLGALAFVQGGVWRTLFGRAADALEKGDNAADEYMLVDEDHAMDRLISVPRDMGQLSCAAFSAGIVRGALACAGFGARVTAHSVPVEGQAKPRTVFLVKFDEDVMRREAQMG